MLKKLNLSGIPELEEEDDIETATQPELKGLAR
jgi:hypothetical protein